MISPRTSSGLILLVLVPSLLWCVGQSRLIYFSEMSTQNAFTSFTLISLSLVAISFALLPNTTLMIQLRTLAQLWLSLLTLPLPLIILAVYTQAFTWMSPAKAILSLLGVTLVLLFFGLLKSTLANHSRLFLAIELGIAVTAIALPIMYYEPWMRWVFANA